MGSINVLLYYVTNFLTVNVMLLEEHIFLFIRGYVQNVVYATGEKYSFTLAETVRFYDVGNLFLAVCLVL